LEALIVPRSVHEKVGAVGGLEETGRNEVSLGDVTRGDTNDGVNSGLHRVVAGSAEVAAGHFWIKVVELGG
jgi:hypothetical protein